MINRIKRILDKALFAKYANEIEINITEGHYENAMAVEQMKEDTISFAMKALIDDLVKIKQQYPQELYSTVKGELDIVIMEGKDFRELEKLLNGLHEIWLQKEQKSSKEKRVKVQG
jgi:hypothetical protein